MQWFAAMSALESKQNSHLVLHFSKFLINDSFDLVIFCAYCLMVAVPVGRQITSVWFDRVIRMWHRGQSLLSKAMSYCLLMALH